MISIGEGKIISILNKARVNFIPEKTFHDLKHGLYRFDFYIPNYNGNQIVVEYNGVQHYSQIKKFHKTRTDFIAAQERDRRKISYCLANGIKIYCIPYWEEPNLKTIDDLLQDKFLARTRWKNDEDWREKKTTNK